jgi:hypothetical protein
MRNLARLGCRREANFGALPVTVTAEECPMTYTDVSDPNNPHIVAVSAIAHDLCIARAAMERGISNIGQWAWGVLQSLEAELERLWAAIKSGLSQVWEWIDNLGTRAKNFLQWLDNQASEAEKWLLIGGLMILAFVLAPAINDVSSNFRRGS